MVCIGHRDTKNAALRPPHPEQNLQWPACSKGLATPGLTTVRADDHTSNVYDHSTSVLQRMYLYSVLHRPTQAEYGTNPQVLHPPKYICISVCSATTISHRPSQETTPTVTNPPMTEGSVCNAAFTLNTITNANNYCQKLQNMLKITEGIRNKITSIYVKIHSNDQSSKPVTCESF